MNMSDIEVKMISYDLFVLADGSGVKPIPVLICTCGFKGFIWEMSAHLITKHNLPKSVVHFVLRIGEAPKTQEDDMVL